MKKTITSLIKTFSLLLALLLFSDVHAQINKAVPVSEALKKITDKYQTKFVYEPAILRGKTTSAATDKNGGQSIEELLKGILYPNNLLFLYVSDNHYAIISKDEKSLQNTPGNNEISIQTNVIKGTIVDDNNLPLPGVNITIKGKSSRASSDNFGNYAIAANKNDVLQFSFIGFKLEEGSSNAQGILNVNLKPDISQLKNVEIISTGYQRISRERSAGSFSKPDIDIVQNRSSSMNIVQRLDGLVPGLTINNAPGTETFQIRGLTTINANASPLFVVDGVVLESNNLNSINPNDVAEVTVLKDATAASIWGSNAANGVIVITTKKGSNTGKIKIDYDGFVNFQGRPQIDYLPSLSSSQFIKAAQEVFNPGVNPYATVTKFAPTTWKPVPAHEELLYKIASSTSPEDKAKFQQQLDNLGNISNERQINDIFYRNALLTNHTISVSGGSEKYTFYGSTAYTGNQNSTPGNNNNTYKINLRQDFKFSDRIRMHLITDLTNTQSSAKRAVSPTTMFLPYAMFREDNGANISMPWLYLPDGDRATFENNSKVNLNYNPLDEANRGYTNTNGLLARINTGLDVKVVKGLTFQGVYGIVKGSNKSTSLDGDDSFLVRRELAQFTKPAVAPATKPTYLLPETGSLYQISNSSSESWNVRNQFVYDNAFNNKKHQITALFGQEIKKRTQSANGSTVRGYDEQLQTFAMLDYATLYSGITGAVLPKGTSNKLEDSFFSEQKYLDVRYRSYYSNIGYTLDSKYTLNASWRIDESNLFGKDKSAQNKPVWSIGGSWLMSNEKFMSKLQWIDRLAVRATYGLSGNSPSPGSAASFDIFAAQNSPLFPGGKALLLSTPGNSALTWESTKTTNLGLDFSIFSRLSGSIDVYNKKTENLIGDLKVNPFTGYSTIDGNQGALRNQGVEISLNSININGRDFKWRTMLNSGYNRNKITDLFTKTAITTGSNLVTQRNIKGYSAYSVFAYQYAGLDNNGAPQIKLADGTITTDRTIAKPDDIVYMGTFQPKWSGGLGNSFNYKDFGLQFNAVYNLGFVMRRDVNRSYSGGRLVPDVGSLTTGNVHSDFANRWKEQGDELRTDIPAYISAKTDPRELNFYYSADRNVVDGSYVKLRDITFSYSLPKLLVNSVNAQSISFRAQVSNIMLWKANKYGIDPEFQSAFTGTRNMPTNQKTFTLGAHVTF